MAYKRTKARENLAESKFSSASSQMPQPSEFHELVFGFIAALGSDLDALYHTLELELRSVGYQSRLIHLITSIPGYDEEIARGKSEYDKLNLKIKLGTKLRERTKRSDIFAALAVKEIRKLRAVENKSFLGETSAVTPLQRTAYVIRQLKTPAEVSALRKTYGD